MTYFTELIDLASERLAGVAVAANDEFFAPKENLLKRGRPIFREGEYTERGKWMDGWETRRRRAPGHDWCVVRLGLPGFPRGFCVDTTHFKGNAPEACSIDVCELAGLDPLTWSDDAIDWVEIVPRSALQPDAENLFSAEPISARSTHIRLNIYPDGGVARFRVHGEVLPDWDRLARSGGHVDLAAVENGALVVAASDQFFGSRQNLILPGRGRDMSDGWETRRRRGPGHDWAIVRLGRRGEIHRVEIDTAHFKGNAPGSASVDVADVDDTGVPELTDPSIGWEPLLPLSRLNPDTLHRFEEELRVRRAVTHARLNIHPDGGVGRLRLWGTLAPAARG